MTNMTMWFTNFRKCKWYSNDANLVLLCVLNGINSAQDIDATVLQDIGEKNNGKVMQRMLHHPHLDQQEARSRLACPEQRVQHG